MATPTPTTARHELAGLATTIRFLRAAHRDRDHGAPLQDGSSCPHCGGMHIHRWGRFSGRQRYRCCHCARTFSTLTGTALHYLKLPQRWRRFLWCHDRRLTVRTAAAILGVDKDTALRWRHRLLEQWRREPREKLTGRLVIGDFCLPHSAKGSRSLSRPPRRHGEAWTFPSWQTDPVTVLVAREDRPELAEMIIETVREDSGGPRVPGLRGEVYDARIGPRVSHVAEIVGIRGPLCTLADFADRIGARYRQEARAFSPLGIYRVRRQLRAWLRPFRGVATRRLDNYLEWFRRRGAGDARRSQQFPPTEPDGPDRQVGAEGPAYNSPPVLCGGRRRPGGGTAGHVQATERFPRGYRPYRVG